MTRQCLCAPTGNARSHNSIFLNAFEAQNLFQNDLDNGGVWVVILVECSGGETPGAHVANAVALVVKSGKGQPEAKDDTCKVNVELRLEAHCPSLLESKLYKKNELKCISLKSRFVVAK